MRHIGKSRGQHRIVAKQVSGAKQLLMQMEVAGEIKPGARDYLSQLFWTLR